MLKADDIQLVHARERRTGKPPKLRIILDDGLVEEAHAAAFADQWRMSLKLLMQTLARNASTV